MQMAPWLLVYWIQPCLTNKLFIIIITMKNNSHGALHLPPSYNPTTNFWGRLASNAIVVANLLEYFKLVELAIVMVLGSVEDEKISP
jgi:hypothetical protein